MDSDDPEERIRELERQLAEQKRIAELEHQIAQANAAAHGQDVPVPPPPESPATPSSPSAPQTGQPITFKGAWVSVDGGEFQQVGGQGTGAALPARAAEKLAEAERLAESIERQTGFFGQGGFGGLGAYPGQGGFGGQGASPGQFRFGPQTAVTGDAGLGGLAGSRRKQRSTRKWGALGIMFAVIIAIGPLIGVMTMVTALVPSSVQWTSGIVCGNGSRLAPNFSGYTNSRGRSGTNIGFQCISGPSSHGANEFAVMGLQVLLALLVLGGIVAVVVMIRRLGRRSSPGILLPLVAIVAVACLTLAVTASIRNAPTGPKQLHSADGMNGLLATIRDRFGDTMGYRLTVYPDYAVLYRADPKNNRVEKPYLYRDANWRDWGSSSSPSSSDSLVDLSKFDVAAVTAKLPGAPRSLGITDAKSTYLIVEGVKGGGLHLSIYVSSDGPTGYLELKPDGSVKQLHPPS